ncbi:DUF4396 domain-containing protein [Acidiphilium acidophilum]|uniref:DUF4396 domain-containing protein n=1 Tax=Acidiphilium acidophilum TaxID=76588 RepID=UPI002E8E7088|nr:DUF4396 domain-containing protein [Acidiphilium acidophilum]
MIPLWLHDLSIGYLVAGALSAAFIAFDIARHPQRMWIMNVVWPVTALFGTLWVIWQYFTYGRLAALGQNEAAGQQDQPPPDKRNTPFPIVVANGALHCGSGCTLGDITAEWLAFGVPGIAAAFGYRSLFDHRIFAVWVLDYILAYGFGIFFQYFTIAPMRGLSVGPGLIAAIKADTLSLTAWQIGMYGFMAFAYFYLFRIVLHSPLRTDTVEFWFMMQIAMIFGFLTTYPMNWWLLRSGIKEPM